jgi:Domain of unknown function (DUF4335)
MALQRIYSLPSCTLVVEGIGSEQILSILTNFECRFLDAQESISGGRNLLLAMSEAVNSYVQNLKLDSINQNGVSQPEGNLQNQSSSQTKTTQTQSIQSKAYLESVTPFEHLLHVQAIAEDSDRTDLISVRLSMVQLFDLIESFDQLSLDSQTLPDLSLELKPGQFKPQKAAPFQSAPILVGAASLAIAVGAAFVFVPPLMKQSEPLPNPDQPPNSRTFLQTKPKPPSLSSEPNKPESEANIGSQITDPELLIEIEEKLRKNIDKAWRNKISFKQDLTYIVEVDKEGEILGFIPTAATRAILQPNADQKLEKLEEELPLKQLQQSKPVQLSSTKPSSDLLPNQTDSQTSSKLPSQPSELSNSRTSSRANNKANIETDPGRNTEGSTEGSLGVNQASPKIETTKFTATFSPRGGGKLIVKPFIKTVDP